MHASIDAKGNGCKLAHRSWGVCIVSTWKELDKKKKQWYLLQYSKHNTMQYNTMHT